MSASDSSERRPVRLNWLGNAALIAEAGSHFAVSLIDSALVKAADLVIETENAFREGLDPNIEEAKVLQEYEERERLADDQND
jgi:hypothetical protein